MAAGWWRERAEHEVGGGSTSEGPCTGPPSVPVLAPQCLRALATPCPLHTRPSAHGPCSHAPPQPPAAPLPPCLTRTLCPTPSPPASVFMWLPAALPGWALLPARAPVGLSTKILGVIHGSTIDKAVNETKSLPSETS